MPKRLPVEAVVAATSGAIIGAMAEAFNEAIKNLRRHAGSGFDQELNALETRAILSVENAPLDGIPEEDQLLITEHTRNVIRALFAGARTI